MPYIPQDRRIEINNGAIPENSGELNYLISKTIKDYLDNKPTRYQTYNDVLGALSGASAEFYEKVVKPYEAEKEAENGPVY